MVMISVAYSAGHRQFSVGCKDGSMRFWETCSKESGKRDIHDKKSFCPPRSLLTVAGLRLHVGTFTITSDSGTSALTQLT